MTNSDAFRSYMDNEDKATLVLTMYSLDPNANDAIKESMALGMMERADDVDYKQLGTSETLSESARRSLRKRALGILDSLGVEYITAQGGNVITSVDGW